MSALYRLGLVLARDYTLAAASMISGGRFFDGAVFYQRQKRFPQPLIPQRSELEEPDHDDQ